MKNGLLIWNAILTLATGYLLYLQLFSGQAKGNLRQLEVLDSLQANPDFRMAYFEMDSVASGSEEVKSLKSELTKKEGDIDAELSRMEANMQQKLLYYQGLEREGKLTQEQAQSASAEIGKLNEDLKARKQQLEQEYSDLMVRRQNEIKSKIENYLKEYNKTKNFSYIVSYEQGLFYFRDTAFNITADLIKGLNSTYKPAKK